MGDEAKWAAAIVAVLVALIFITGGADDGTPSDYPSDMDSCIYTGPGGWDC